MWPPYEETSFRAFTRQAVQHMYHSFRSIFNNELSKCLSDVLSLVHRTVFIPFHATTLLPFYMPLAFFLPSCLHQTHVIKLDIPL